MLFRSEFSYRQFEQCMVLPDDADKEKIAAKVENGVLKIDIPKVTEAELKKNQRLITVG